MTSTTIPTPTKASISTAPKNKTLITAAILAILVDVLHIFGGGATIVRPLLASSLADEPRLVLYAVWHMTTAAMGLSAIAFFMAALPRYAAANRNLVFFVSAMWISFGLSFFGVAIFEGGSLLSDLKQPIFLMPVGFVGLWGATQIKSD